MKRSKLYKSIMMAGVLGGLGIGGLGAGLYSPSASAVNLPANGLGEVLIFPYYTVRDNWQTTFSIINTDENNIVAVRFRVIEGMNSRDVRDFTLILSPGDMFAGVLEADGAGGARLRRAPGDTTCTSPFFAPSTFVPLSVDAFSGTSTVNGAVVSDEDGAMTDPPRDRLNEGYILAIVMGHTPVSGAGAAALDAGVAAYDIAIPGRNLTGTLTTLRSAVRVNGVNTDAECTAVADLFDRDVLRDPNPATVAPSANSVVRLFGEPINVLKGNYSFLNVPRGTAAGGNAVALANFATFNVPARDGATPRAPLPACNWMFTTQFGPPLGAYPNNLWSPLQFPTDCPNMITAQDSPDFLEPTLNASYPAFAVNLENTANDPSALGVANVVWPAPAAPGTFAGSPYGFLAVSEVLRAATLTNEWSINPNLGVSTDWVVTHPTKSFFTDRPIDANGDSPQAAINRYRFPQSTTGVAWGPESAPFTLLPADASGRSYAPPFAQGGRLRPFAQNFDGQSCNQVAFRLFNADERSASPGGSGPVFSPDDPAPNLALCYETNVIPFTTGGMPTMDNPGGVFGSRLLPQSLDNLYTAMDTVGRAGWMRLDLFADSQADQNPTAFPTAANTLNGPGLPAVGFMIRERAIPASTIDSYSDAANHSVSRIRP
jgi:hypothetical protein